jgi:hypothetical protein
MLGEDEAAAPMPPPGLQEHRCPPTPPAGAPPAKGHRARGAARLRGLVAEHAADAAPVLDGSTPP